jgi:hypothetical protein
MDKKMKLSKKELKDEAIYNQALELLSDYFNKGKISKDKNDYIHGVATIFAQWGINIRNNSIKKLIK